MKNFCRRLILIICIVCATTVVANAAQMLVPGGQVVGLVLQENGITVDHIDPVLGEQAQKAGLRKGDKILQVNERSVASVEALREALRQSDGTVRLTVLRSGKTKVLQVKPTVTEEGPKLGVYLKEGITGLGTVTFYDPKTGSFGALGHGINSADGALLRMTQGQVCSAKVVSIKKGAIGAPGQLLGSLLGEKTLGKLEKNTLQGVFGKLSGAGEPLPVGRAKEGAAVIRSTVGTDVQEYSVEILKIYPNTTGRTRNLLLRVTDQELLQTTGGIVQGMSGSPILQDGCIVGAVTHVLVNDPTMGYGIFIENMLDAA